MRFDSYENERQIKRGDVIMVDFGERPGYEQDGIRPAIVVQNDIGNEHSPTTIVAPFTAKKGREVELPIHVTGIQLKRTSMALLEQVTTIDKSRIIGHITQVDDDTLNQIDEKLRVALAL